MSTLAEVRMWGSRIGAILLEDGSRTAVFEYEPAFARRGIELSPISMPLGPIRYTFPALAEESFHGLPGLLCDSLPDRYGHALIDAWLATQGRSPESFNVVERLCYIGGRGMGALEYRPSTGPAPAASHLINVGELAELAGEVLAQREGLVASLRGEPRARAMEEILRIGTSAGGARAKALIALDPATLEIRSGQLDAPDGFEHWILKFDGVSDETRELGRARGYGIVEFVYSQMARGAGVEMSECRLLEEGGRHHFMTRRFDRVGDGDRLHMQSLAALAHLDFNQPGANGYEQAFQVISALGLPMAAIEQQYRRMIFNVVARNQDDHVKNIAFLMDRAGNWSLSPAFDLAYSFNPAPGKFTALHQMSINGKRDGFTLEDFRAVGRIASMRRNAAEEIIEEVTASVRNWPELAAAAGLDDERIEAIGATHRLDLLTGRDHTKG